MATSGIADLLERCARAGIALEVDAGQLVADAPATESAERLLAEVAGQKAAVLAALEAVWPAVARKISDPRPDISDDAAQWRRLLRLAVVEHGDQPGTVYEGLHVVRCCGGRLVRTAAGSWRIVAGDEYAGDWEADRATALVPHRQAIGALLGRLDACDPTHPAAAAERDWLKSQRRTAMNAATSGPIWPGARA